jgi:hypothetical protein
VAYGESIIQHLHAYGDASAMRFVVNTAQNGNGPWWNATAHHEMLNQHEVNAAFAHT